MTYSVVAEGLVKRFGTTRALDGINLEVLPRVGADLERPQHRDLHVTILPGAG